METDKNKSPELPDWLNKKIHYWFVQYNPLYFFSALCVITGVFLISRGLNDIQWNRGQIILTAVIEIYQISVLCGAWLLFYKARERRPAVILGLVAVVFLFDCTIQTEIIAGIEPVGIFLTAAWIVLSVLKLIALIKIFQLNVPKKAMIVPVLTGIAIAGMPHLFAYENIDKNSLHVLATWFGAGIVCYISWMRPKITSAVSLDKWGQTVLFRAVTATWFIWEGFYLYHLLIWGKLFGIPMTSAHIIPFLLIPTFLSDRERTLWLFSSLSFAMSLLNPTSESIMALIISVILGINGLRIQQPRLYAGAVLGLWFACWTMGWQAFPLPKPNIWLNLATGVILIIMGWRMKSFLPFCIVVIGLLFTWKTSAPHGPLEWGIVLVITGFVALIAGVIINWHQRSDNSKSDKDDL